MYISEELIATIKELQQLTILEQFYLAGGTNLSIRYNHRESVDIDLFCEDIIGIEGFYELKKNIEEHFQKRIINIGFPTSQSDELVYLKTILKTENSFIKVEFIQGFKLLFPISIIDGMRLADEKDIGLFKLESLVNRYAEKDLYDLDYITDNPNQSLEKLMSLYAQKKQLYIESNINTIFTLSNDFCPLKNPELLLLENHIEAQGKMPYHSDSKLRNNKTSFRYHKLNWNVKVKSFLKNSI